MLERLAGVGCLDLLLERLKIGVLVDLDIETRSGGFPEALTTGPADLLHIQQVVVTGHRRRHVNTNIGRAGQYGKFPAAVLGLVVGRLGDRLVGPVEAGGVLEVLDLIGGDAAQPLHLGIDPLAFVDVAAHAHLEAQPLGPGEVDRLDHSMVDRAHHLDAVAADPVAQGEDVVDRVDVEGEVLHRAGGDRIAGVARVGDAPLRFGRVAGCLHEGDVAVAGEFDETVERVGYPVHPVQRPSGAAEHLGEEGELRLHVGGRQRGKAGFLEAARVDASEHGLLDRLGRPLPDRTINDARLAEAAAPGAPPGHLHCQTVVDDPGVGYQWFIEVIDPIQIGKYSSFDRRWSCFGYLKG